MTLGVFGTNSSFITFDLVYAKVKATSKKKKKHEFSKVNYIIITATASELEQTHNNSLLLYMLECPNPLGAARKKKPNINCSY